MIIYVFFILKNYPTSSEMSRETFHPPTLISQRDIRVGIYSTIIPAFLYYVVI